MPFFRSKCSKIVFSRQNMTLVKLILTGRIVAIFTKEFGGSFWTFFHSKMFYKYRTQKVPKVVWSRSRKKSSVPVYFQKGENCSIMK